MDNNNKNVNEIEVKKKAALLMLAIIITLIIIIIVMFKLYISKYNKELNNKINNFSTNILKDQIKENYESFVNEASNDGGKGAYNLLNDEINYQVDTISKKKYLPSGFKSRFINEQNQKEINQIDEELQKYLLKVQELEKFFELDEKVPKSETPGYFVLMQSIINKYYDLDNEVIRKYNGEPVKVAFLTFDDGPTKNTKKILKILDKKGVKGTFFVLGTSIEKDENEIERILKDGNTVALHSYSHDIPTMQSENGALDEMILMYETLKDDYGYDTNIIRIPQGSDTLNEVQINELEEEGFKIVDWTIDSHDWTESADVVIENVTKSVGADVEIILFHEKDATIEALPEIIDDLRGDGYYFVTPPRKINLEYVFE